MLTSLLVREGRPFELVLGRIDDPEAVAAVARRAARRRGGEPHARRPDRARRPAAAGLRLRRHGWELLRAATGIELVPIEPAELLALYRAVAPARVRALEAETRARYDVELEGDGLARSLRAACAIDDLADGTGSRPGR